MDVTDGVTVRRARADDESAVVSFTSDTWPDRDGGDYIPRVFADWVANDGPDQRTFVAEVDGEVAGLVQAVLLSDHEAWLQGMRVAPEARNRGVGVALTHRGFDWARERGATVARAMVFSWNTMGLGLSRAAGFDPAAEFRWVTPDPDPDADPSLSVTDEADAAWAHWQTADAREHLGGLALDPGESWACSDLTRDRLRAAADDGRLHVVQSGGTRGFAVRVRTVERDEKRVAVYGVASWADVDACGALFEAIARDAAAVDADATRVLVPETVAAISDAALNRVPVDDEPDFVLAADLTRR